MNLNAISETPAFRLGRFTFAIERGVPPPPRREFRRALAAPCRYFQPRRLRWALSGARRRTLFAALDTHGTPDALAFRDLVAFVTTCGPRIEEALALTTRDAVLTGSRPRISLPDVGGSSRISLPLSPAAAAILRRRALAVRDGIERGELAPGEARFWPRHYTWARDRWDMCRVIIGATEEPTATLKALRRSAAAHLHLDLGMPIARVSRYLRHRHVETTREYLRVTEAAETRGCV